MGARLGPGSDVDSFCRAWVTSDPFSTLLAEFDSAPLDASLPTADLLARIEAFSDVWDFRRRKERNEATIPEFTGHTCALIDKATSALGLQDTLPPERDHYDHVVVLGGLARGCIARPLHAARLIESGTLTATRLTALGAFRPLTGAEWPLLEAFGMESAKTEFDVMDYGVRRAFCLDDPAERESDCDADGAPIWGINRYERADGLTVEVAAAPAPEPGRRANTGETYEWLATRPGALSLGDSVLLVTTFHYRLYQLADAIRLIGLPHRLDLDAVGMVPGYVDDRLEWLPSAGALLQETRSAIRSLRLLHRAAQGPDVP